MSLSYYLWLDLLGAALSLSCTFYFTKAKRCAWSLGILATLLNIILYLKKTLYGTALLEGVYCGIMIYGWLQWAHSSTRKKQYIIKTLSYLQLSLLIGVALILILGLGALFNCLASEAPYWEASITVLSLIAQLLLCFKIIHCWMLWFFVDTLMIVLQYQKALFFHSALHCLYLLMAISGYYHWCRLSEKQSTFHFA